MRDLKNENSTDNRGYDSYIYIEQLYYYIQYKILKVISTRISQIPKVKKLM